MSASPLAKVWTWQEALALPDGERYEVIDGELKERCVSSKSSLIASYLANLLWRWMDEFHYAGWVTGEQGGFTIFPWTAGDVRMPDVAFISAKRAPTLPERGWLDVPPELAIEVVSPNDLASDIDQKAQDFVAAGVDMVWVVFPRTRTIAVYRNGQSQRSFGPGETITGESVLPGLEIEIDKLFARFG